MSPALLFTQCLQNDFVQPIGRYDPLPNELHVGWSEAVRLLGEEAGQGPVARTMRWALAQPDSALRLIHLRDWHDATDPDEAEHLRHFGPHCLQGTSGADFAFPAAATDKQIEIVDTVTLNDFHGTRLAEVLAPFADTPMRAGIIGVWTEAKVQFLAYELRTRYPRMSLAVCSALTASSSRQAHFDALDHLQRILGVTVLDSVGAFLEFLGGKESAPLTGISDRFPEIEVEGAIQLSPTDRTLVRFLFRDCRHLRLRGLDGGFSGNIVAGTHSVDMHGHDQVPHVLKIGPQELMGRERASFERVQQVLGNNAPQVSDFADWGDRGAIKYRYASMSGTFSTTFQGAYQRGMAQEEVERVLDTVFGEQLHRFSKAAVRESADLLDHYQFSARWAPSVRRKVDALLSAPATGATLEIRPGVVLPNVVAFYAETLAKLPRRPREQAWQAWVHGDLNGANIILDRHDNVWLIDFFHTRRAHVLMDLAKLENDLLYIFTPLSTEEELAEAFRFTDAILAMRDLAAPPPEQPPSALPQLRRAWATLRKLRSFYPGLLHADRDPFQSWVPMLRYAVHTLSFDESTPLQRTWALYTACQVAGRIATSLANTTRLRVDDVAPHWPRSGRLGLTILPGRKDYGRDLVQDIATLQAEGISRVLTLLGDAELDQYGVPGLVPALRAAGLQVLQVPIVDQKACSREDMERAVAFLEAGLQAGQRCMVHCVGGLGRSGMVAACLLRAHGLDTTQALAAVRKARGPRAVEVEVQEAMVEAFRSGRV